MRILSILIAAFVLSIPQMVAQKNVTPDPVDMTIDENLAYPTVPNKASAPLIRHMEGIARVFAKHGLETKALRKGEVVDIIVPCSMLFAPNSSELTPESSKVLNAFSAIVKLPQSYKILVVVHTDDAASSEYADKLTEERANAIDKYLTANAPGISPNVIPYGVGADEPRGDNNSIGGRAANRRVDFYIVPEKATIDMARSNKL